MTAIMNRYGRVGEIFLALLEVAPNEEIRNRLIDFEQGVFEDQKEEEATSLEAEVLRSILNSKELAIDGRLAVKNIVDSINAGRDDKDKLRPERVGWITTRLGFRKGRMPDSKGNRAILFDSELLDRLCQTYDVDSMNAPHKQSDRQTDREKAGLDAFADSSDSLTDREGYGKQPEILDPTPILPNPELPSHVLSNSSNDPAQCQTVSSDIDEAVNKLRGMKSAPTLEHYIDYATTLLKNSEKAESLIQQLRRDGELIEDPSGDWTWRRQ
jgi:hypothetical protein